MNQNYTTIPIFTIGEIRKMAKKQLKGKWRAVLPVMLVFQLLVTLPALILQLYSYNTEMSNLSAMLDSNLSAGMSTGSSISLYTQIGAGSAGIAALTFAVWVYAFLTSGAFSVSLSALSLRILRNEPFSVKTAFFGFTQFTKSFITYLLVTIFSFLWMLLFMLAGGILLGFGFASQSAFLTMLTFIAFFALMIAAIIFLMRYDLSFFIAADDNYTAAETVKRSVQLMRGNISNYFLLMISFLPWILLLCVPVMITAGAAATALTAASSTVTALAAVISVIFGVISLIGNAFLTIYMQTASAVFYSGASGNFRSSANTSYEAASASQNFSGDLPHSDAHQSYADPFTDSAQSDSVSSDAAAKGSGENVSPSVSQENTENHDDALSILENDDSLDHLYEDEDK